MGSLYEKPYSQVNDVEVKDVLSVFTHKQATSYVEKM